MLEEFIKYILGEWRVIAQTPANFAVAVIVVGLLIWAAMTWGYGREMSLLKEQIADYKTKLGSTPDAAKARIDELEKRLLSLSPRRLTKEQREMVVERGRPSNSESQMLLINHEGGCPDCPVFAADLERAFRDSGWQISNGVVMGPARRPSRGLGFQIEDPNNLSAGERIIEAALRAANIEFEIMQGSVSLPGIGRVPQLLITARAAN